MPKNCLQVQILPLQLKLKTMKLELKHLASYLPYGLKMTRNGFVGKLICIRNPKENSLVDYYEFQVSCSDWWENNTDDLNPYKPILRPLSDLTKEIEHNGERFVPIDYFLGEDYDLVYNACLIHNDFSYLPYNLVQLLLEWHFDLFQLTEQGLAIDINTLT